VRLRQLRLGAWAPGWVYVGARISYGEYGFARMARAVVHSNGRWRALGGT